MHKKSNHHPRVIRNIPEGVNKWLRHNYANEELFKAAIPIYQEAFKDVGYDYELKNEAHNEDPAKVKKSRKRRVLWFDPPFSKNVKTNVDQSFLSILDKCSPP